MLPMSRRIEVELTSARDDGTWTWRAAGAREPKGALDAALLPDGSSVGDVLRVDAEFGIDGIEIIGVLPPKAARAEPERLEIIGRPVDDRPVTTRLTSKPGARDGDRRGRGDGKQRRPRRDRKAKSSEPTDHGERPKRKRTERPEPDTPPRPKTPRLRPKRTHRDQVLAELPEEHKPVAEQVLSGGVPAVRQAIEKRNAEAREAGEAEVNPDKLVALAEQLLPSLRAAEWRDRAEAALEGIDTIDLRDIRSVVVAADSSARDDEARALAQQLQAGLSERVDREHRSWLDELAATLRDGRAVRALRLSSRPPKAGAPLPGELAAQLTDAAAASLTSETGQQRYATVLDALAYSPVRTHVKPQGLPAEPGEELLSVVKRVSSRIPGIAAMFGIEATKVRRRPRRQSDDRSRPPSEAATPESGQPERSDPDPDRSDGDGPEPKSRLSSAPTSPPPPDSEPADLS